MQKLSLWAIALVSGLCFTTQGFAIVQQADRLEVDWVNQRVRFFGEYKPNAAGMGPEGLKKGEQSARFEAMQWLDQKAPQILKDKFGVSDVAASVSALKNAVSQNTMYAQDGRVRVYFDRSLAEVLGNRASVAGLQVPQKTEVDKSVPKNTGLIVRVSGVSMPLADYRIVDEDQNTLFDVSKVETGSYRKRHLGRWLKGSASSKTKELVGLSPAVVNARLGSEEQTLVVKRSEWDQAVTGNQSYLSRAELVLSIESEHR